MAKGIVKVPVALRTIDGNLNQPLIASIFPDYVAQIAAERAAAAAAAEQAKRQQEAQEPWSHNSAPPLKQPDNVNCNVAKCIALTFDDGPGAGTSSILDTLKQYNAKASFFMIGRQVPSRAGLVQRIANEGHDIGNHTWDHKDLSTLGAGGIGQQIGNTQQAIINATGKQPFMVRPPYGAYNQTTLNTIGLPLVLWNIDPNDWRDRNAATIYSRVMSAAKPGAIVLSHDIYTTTADAYAHIIPDLISRGYSLVTVSDMLGINPTNPPVRVYR